MHVLLRIALFASLFLLPAADAAAQQVFGFEYRKGKNDSVLVMKVFKNGPAAAAGLLPGDLLRKLNTTSFTGLSEEELRQTLSSAPVSGNELLLLRQGSPMKLRIDKREFTSFNAVCIGNCANGACTVELYNGNSIRGNCRDGKINGEGLMVDAAGRRIYVGQFVNNQMQGRGSYYYEDSSVYVGEWMDNRAHGNGTRTFADGDRFEGVHVAGQWQGYGVYYFKSGSIYRGAWVNSKMEGAGTMRYSGGDVYEGNFRDNKRQGRGMMKFADGRTYDGYWKNDIKSGQGKFTWTDGMTYEGEFREDVINGQGVLRYADGKVYSGNLVKGQREGQGTLTGKDGDVYTGEFRNGKRHGKGVRNYGNTDGRHFEGEYRDDELYYGTLRLKSGSTYTGYFKDGKSEGEGKGSYADGSTIQGTFRDGKPWNAVQSFPDGKLVTFREGSGTVSNTSAPVPSARPASSISTASLCREIRTLIKASDNGFKSLRGNFSKLLIRDSLFLATPVIAGATRSTVLVEQGTGNSVTYGAVLLETRAAADVELAREQIVSELGSCLSSDFVLTTRTLNQRRYAEFKRKGASGTFDPAIVSVVLTSFSDGSYLLEVEVQRPDTSGDDFLDKRF